MQEQRVAVGLRLGDPRRTERAAGAAHVFDQHLLAEIARHGFRHEAGDGIGRTAGRKRHDDGDRAVGIALGHRHDGRKHERNQRTAAICAWFPPGWFLRHDVQLWSGRFDAFRSAVNLGKNGYCTSCHFPNQHAGIGLLVAIGGEVERAADSQKRTDTP